MRLLSIGLGIIAAILIPTAAKAQEYPAFSAAIADLINEESMEMHCVNVNYSDSHPWICEITGNENPKAYANYEVNQILSLMREAAEDTMFVTFQYETYTLGSDETKPQVGGLY